MLDQTETAERRRIAWAEYDPAVAKANLHRMRRRSCLTLLGVSLAFCCFLSLLTNVAQSYIGQWLAAPPVYPGAIQTDQRIGQLCVPTLAVYCYQTFYETPDSPAQVVAFYETYRDIRFRSPLRFAAENRYPFGQQQSARYCRYVLGYRSCVQISVHPLNVGSELYIQEIGGAQKLPEG